MRRRWCIAALFVAMTISISAQDQAFIRLGPAFAYRSTSATLSTEIAGRTITSSPSSILADALGITIGASFPIAERLHLRADVESFTSSGTASDIQGITVVVNGETVSGSIQRDHDLRSSWYAVATGLSYHALPRLNIDAIVGAQAVTSFTATWSETITNPSGATWVSTGTPTRTFSPVTTDGTPTRISAFVGMDLGTSIPLSGSWFAQPALRFRYTVTPALNGSSWRPWDLGFSLSLAWSSAPSPRTAMTRMDQRRDTVTMIDAFSRERADTLWRTRTEERTDTVRGDELDTIVISQRMIVERHIPAPPPFLSTILNVSISAHEIDSLISVHVNASVESDTSTTTELSAFVDGRMVWSERATLKEIRRTVSLGTLVPDLAQRSRITVTMHAITTDAFGQRREAVPATFSLRRAAQDAPLQKD